MTVIPPGQPGTNSAFVLAVLIAVIVAGLWWGIVAACLSTVLITYFFIEPRGPHLTSEAVPVIAVFAVTVVVAAVLARSLSQARDQATASLAERELALAELDRQIDRERSATRAFQSAVLQEVLPTVQSASLEAFYRPALSMYEIGGDWYDVLEHRDGRVTVTVGDICGKGVSAAAEMVRLSKALRIYAAEGYAPGEVLARVDAAMLDGTLREVFATAVCATFDPTALTLRYATAGHPSPLLVRATGESEFLDRCASAPLTYRRRRASERDGAARAGRLRLLLYGRADRAPRPHPRRRFRRVENRLRRPTRHDRNLGQIVDTLTLASAAEDDICLVRLNVSEAKLPVALDRTQPSRAITSVPDTVLPHSRPSPQASPPDQAPTRLRRRGSRVGAVTADWPTPYDAVPGRESSPRLT